MTSSSTHKSLSSFLTYATCYQCGDATAVLVSRTTEQIDAELWTVLNFRCVRDPSHTFFKKLHKAW